MLNKHTNRWHIWWIKNWTFWVVVLVVALRNINIVSYSSSTALYVVLNSCICIQVEWSFYKKKLMFILKEKRTLTITYSTYCIYILKVVDLIVHICKLFSI